MTHKEKLDIIKELIVECVYTSEIDEIIVLVKAYGAFCIEQYVQSMSKGKMLQKKQEPKCEAFETGIWKVCDTCFMAQDINHPFKCHKNR